jgi:hypothetical protein
VVQCYVCTKVREHQASNAVTSQAEGIQLAKESISDIAATLGGLQAQRMLVVGRSLYTAATVVELAGQLLVFCKLFLTVATAPLG